MILEFQIQRLWNGIGMVKNRLKKGEGQKIVLDAIDNKWKTIIKIKDDTKINYTTIDEALKVLVPGKAEKLEVLDEEGNKIVKYRSKITKDAVDPKYLRMIIDNYNSGNPDRMNMALCEITDLGHGTDLRILDKEFIDFSFNNYLNFLLDKNQDFEIPFYLICLEIIKRLKKDIDIHPENSERQIELLSHIQNNWGKKYNGILSNMKTKSEVMGLLTFLIHMNYPNYHNIVFQILDNDNFDITEFEDFYIIKKKILEYSKINITDCKKRLWNIYEKQTNEKKKETIKDLIEETSIGHHIS